MLGLYNIEGIEKTVCCSIIYQDDCYIAVAKDCYSFGVKLPQGKEKKFFALCKGREVFIHDVSTGMKVKAYNYVGESVEMSDCLKESVARFRTDADLLSKYYDYMKTSAYGILRDLYVEVSSSLSALVNIRDEVWNNG